MATAPEVRAQPADVPPSEWSPRPVPRDGVGVTTADPITPTNAQLAARAQAAALAGSSAGPGQPTPGAAPITDPSQCAGAWADVDKQTDAVLRQGIDPHTGTMDVLRRNAAITAAYAQLYEENPRLRWAGVAAFASKQVGCGLRDARAIAQAPDSALERLPPVNPIITAGKGAVEAQRWAARYMEGALGRGNEAVFRDIYPVHRFYEDNGLNALQTCQGARPGGRLPAQVVQAFGELDGEGRTPSETDLRTAAGRILRYEQSQTLQAAVYDDPTTTALLVGNQAAFKAGEMTRWVGGDKLVRSLGVRPVEVAFTEACEGTPSERFEGLNLGNFSERWPYAQRVANRFQDMVQEGGAARAQIQRGLRALGGTAGR